jgi:fatty acid-binding protein DegV
VDDRDRADDDALPALHRGPRAVVTRSGACSAQEIREIFLQELVVDYERVLVISAGAEFSELFQRATEASYSILQDYRQRRAAGERSGSFALRVLDRRTLCAVKPSWSVAHCSCSPRAQLGFEKMRRALQEDTARVGCLLVPGDPWYLRRRGVDGNGRGLSWADFALARSFDVLPVVELAGGKRRTVARLRGFDAACAAALARAGAAIARGLGTPALVLSFGGDPRVIRAMDAYQALEARAAEARIDMHFSVMSATMGARVGPGALSVAWLGAN